MISAGKEEREIAITNNSYHQGVHAVTVIVDGGWSKHSHKHSYNVKSGVAIIIGKATGKILHWGNTINFAQFVIIILRHHLLIFALGLGMILLLPWTLILFVEGFKNIAQ